MATRRTVGPGGVLTLRELNRATLARQLLLSRERIPAPRAIERLVGVQAQWPRPPFLGLWSRVEGFERSDLVTLLDERRVVRATFLRGTLHLATAKDFLALREALQPVLDSGMRAVLKALGTAFDIDRLKQQARRILDEVPRTFEELREELLRANPGAHERALGYAVRMQLPLVQVPVGDGAPWAFPANARFALAEQWLRKPLSTGSPSPDALVLRYLAGYGPASVADVQAWSGLPKLKATLDGLRPRLAVFRDEAGRELFDLPTAPRPAGDVPAPVRLVADYDNLITTRADERFVAKGHRPKVFLSALRVAATVLIDGFVAGTWKLARKQNVATLVVEPFAPLSARDRTAVLAEAEPLLRFAEPDARSFEARVSR
jgi:hypothetical protein